METKESIPEKAVWAPAYGMYVFESDRTPIVKPHYIVNGTLRDVVLNQVMAIRIIKE